MRIVMIGTGYVGLVSGACFSDFGHHVVCVDKDEAKVRALLEGGKRTATLWASTPIRVAVIPPEAIDESVLPELAAGRRREDG